MLTSATRHNPPNHRRVNILWIDDKIEKFTYDISDIALNRFQIFCCSDVSDFFNIISNYFIDVCVIDLNLNQMDRGEDLIEYVNNRHKLTKIVIYTSSYTEDDDHEFDEFGNVRLSVSARDFVRPSTSPRKLLKAIKTQLSISEAERKSKKQDIKPPREYVNYFPPSWPILTNISDFSFKRIIPAILILNFIIRLTPIFDPELKIINSIIENYSMVISFCGFIFVCILHRYYCNIEIARNPSYEVFMSRNINLYENDEVFSKNVNNKLEEYGVEYLSHRSFDRLKLFYNEASSESKNGRFFTFISFLLACVAFLVSLAVSLFEVLRLAAA